MLKRIWIRAALRQACFGLVAVALSLPILWAVQRRVGLTPGSERLWMLGASVVVAFVGGGLIGAGSREFGRGTSFGRGKAGAWVAPLAGLLFGILISTVAASDFGQGLLEDAAKEGAMRAWQGRDQFLDRSRAANIATNTAKELAVQGAARLPALILLAWAPLGAMLAALLEYRLAARR